MKRVKLLDKYHLEFECLEFMMTYVTDNEFIEEFIGNMLFIEDIVDAKESLSNESNSITDEKFPVVIRVSPYASERDILDYVKRCTPSLYCQFKRGIRNKLRLERLKTRDNLSKTEMIIYTKIDTYQKGDNASGNRQIRWKYSIDYGYIGKIISLESKKRKEL